MENKDNIILKNDDGTVLMEFKPDCSVLTYREAVKHYMSGNRFQCYKTIFDSRVVTPPTDLTGEDYAMFIPFIEQTYLPVYETSTVIEKDEIIVKIGNKEVILPYPIPLNEYSACWNYMEENNYIIAWERLVAISKNRVQFEPKELFSGIIPLIEIMNSKSLILKKK